MGMIHSGLARAALAAAWVAGLGCSNPPPEAPGNTGGVTAGTDAGGASAGGPNGVSGDGGASGGAGASSIGGSSGGSVPNAGSANGGGAGAGGAGGFEGGALAAVTLTYDDGLDPHLATVQPALDAVGLLGTFFLSNFEGVDHLCALPNATEPLTIRHMAWQAAAQKGHELAGHTVNHPCDNPGKAAGFRLTDYTMARLTLELDDSLQRLTRLGGAQPFTFAYPCATDRVGIGQAGEDYSSQVATRFLAARVSNGGIADPATVDLQRVPQRDTEGKTGDELKAMVDEAIAAQGWLVLTFHGVGQETSCAGLAYAPDQCMINYKTTSTEAHAALVAYLAEKKPQVWTATFKQVATYIQSQR